MWDFHFNFCSFPLENCIVIQFILVFRQFCRLNKRVCVCIRVGFDIFRSVIHTNIVCVDDSWLKHMVNELFDIVLFIFLYYSLSCKQLQRKKIVILLFWAIYPSSKAAAMKFAVDFITKHSGRIGTLTKGDIDIKTPLVLHYTKVLLILSLPNEAFYLFLFKICVNRLPVYRIWAERCLIYYAKSSRVFRCQLKRQVLWPMWWISSKRALLPSQHLSMHSVLLHLKIPAPQ